MVHTFNLRTQKTRASGSLVQGQLAPEFQGYFKVARLHRQTVSNKQAPKELGIEAYFNSLMTNL